MRVICHLGFPRTGTTFLQSNIFPIHKDINNLGPKNYINWDNVKITQDDLDLICKQNFDDNLKNGFINKINKNFIQYFEEDKINIITSERFASFYNLLNDFRDLRYFEILLKQNFKNVKFDFLITLRNQYDLIKSYYYHDYANISKFLKMKKFKFIFNFIDKKDENSVPLNLFLNQFDFNYLHNKLTNKFVNSKIKYLFFEDLKSNKYFFSDELSDFCEFEKNYTRKLFDAKKINYNTIKHKKDYYVKEYIYKIIRSKIYLNIKKIIPFKNLLKNFFWEHLILSKDNNIENEKFFREKIDQYYLKSNLHFFEQTKIINKYKY